MAIRRKSLASCIQTPLKTWRLSELIVIPIVIPKRSEPKDSGEVTLGRQESPESRVLTHRFKPRIRYRCDLHRLGTVNKEKYPEPEPRNTEQGGRLDIYVGYVQNLKRFPPKLTRDQKGD